MLEKDIESYFRARARGKVLKWVCPGETGVPDRVWIKPGGQVAFIEFKKPGGRLAPRQKLWGERLTLLGHEVHVISSIEEARELLRADQWDGGDAL